MKHIKDIRRTLRTQRSPGKPAGSQDQRQTGALGPTDTEHRTDNAKDRAIDANANRERVGNRGAR